MASKEVHVLILRICAHITLNDVLIILYHDKISKGRNNLFVSWLQRFQSIVLVSLILGRTSWWWNCVAEDPIHLRGGRKQRMRKELGIRYNLQRHARSYLLLLTWPSILKFLTPHPSKKALPPGDHVPNTWTCGEFSYSNHNSCYRKLMIFSDCHKTVPQTG
jgi:hypothetical protein